MALCNHIQLCRQASNLLIFFSLAVVGVCSTIPHQVLGQKSLAVIADSPSLPRRELEAALAAAKQFEFPVRIVRTQEFENPAYLANPNNRCYFCKHELFTGLAPLAKAEGFAVIAYGENASDVGDFRPGAQAAVEFQVRAPLKEAGLTKAEIRQLSAELGLPTADKPQMACLSSRIPYGEQVTEEKLLMIERAENVLRDLGFYDVRVRHHELGASTVEDRMAANDLQTENSASRITHFSRRSQTKADHASHTNHLARIEVGSSELPRLLKDGLPERVATALKQLGYAHVTVDLQGYRRGS